MAALNGKVAKLKFDPDDPAGDEAAVRRMGALIDQKAGRYSSNPIVGPFKSKEAFAAAIRAKARRT